MDNSLRSQVRFTGFSRSRIASACVLAACAGLSLALHVGMLASVPASRGGFGMSRLPHAEAIFRADIIPASAAAESEASWIPPERLAPIGSQLPRPRRMQTLTAGAWIPPRFDESAYFRASQLTVRPKAAEYIAVPYPKDVTEDGTWHTSLAIYIDEDGTVARVEIVGPRLPKSLEDAAITAFGSARYAPGRIDDTPVKSRMLVTVDFSNEASDVPPPRVIAVPGKR